MQVPTTQLYVDESWTTTSSKSIATTRSEWTCLQPGPGHASGSDRGPGQLLLQEDKKAGESNHTPGDSWSSAAWEVGSHTPFKEEEKAAESNHTPCNSRSSAAWEEEEEAGKSNHTPGKTWSEAAWEVGSPLPFKKDTQDIESNAHLPGITEEAGEEDADLFRMPSPRDTNMCGHLLTTWEAIDSELQKCGVDYASGCA